MYVRYAQDLKCPEEGEWLAAVAIDEEGETRFGGYLHADEVKRLSEVLAAASDLERHYSTELDEGDITDPHLERLVVTLATAAVMAGLHPERDDRLARMLQP